MRRLQPEDGTMRTTGRRRGHRPADGRSGGSGLRQPRARLRAGRADADVHRAGRRRASPVLTPSRGQGRRCTGRRPSVRTFRCPEPAPPEHPAQPHDPSRKRLPRHRADRARRPGPGSRRNGSGPRDGHPDGRGDLPATGMPSSSTGLAANERSERAVHDEPGQIETKRSVTP